MAYFSKLCVTDAGKHLLNLKLNSERELSLTEMAMSEKKYDVALLKGLTELEDVRQRTGIRKMSIEGHMIRANALFLNSELEEGYYANTLGVYARLGEEPPVLFAVATEQAHGAYMPRQSQTLSGMEIKLKLTLENADQITIQMDSSAMATVGDVLELESEMENHMCDIDNPHLVSKEQVGLGEADNTSDLDKPVSTAQQGAIDASYRQSAAYTDNKIADLINGAPDTLDTLGEIAQAMRDNEDVVSALSAAIGTKANQADLNSHMGNQEIHITSSERQAWNDKQTKTGNTQNNTVSFTSSDSKTPNAWGEIDLVRSGEKHGTLFDKFSLAVRNLRFLWSQLGTANISGIGDSTVKGAISALNTGLSGKAPSSHTHKRSQITDFPTSLPASDVYPWAKASAKPGYTWGEIGGKPGSFTPSAHTHSYLPLTGGTITGSTKLNDRVQLQFGSWAVYGEGTQMFKIVPKEGDFVITLGVTESMWSLCPWSDCAYALGTPGHRISQVYARNSVISTSDRNQKKDIIPITDKYLDFFALLQPVSYRFKDGTGGRTHVGYIAQDVERAMAQSGLSDLDFAGFCRDKVGEDYVYSLRYEEFIALNTAVIQRLQAKITNLEQRLENLETKFQE